MNNNESIKIGARVLSDEALQILLPEYKNIFQQIKAIRKTAYEYRNSKRDNRNKEYDAQFNNVFSILGDRGTGKTSAVLTIKNKITKENKQDIVLDLIVPENMGDNSDVLGWLFAQFQKKVEELTKELGDSENKRRIKDVANAGFYNDYYKDCILKRENSLTQKFDDLIKHYRYIDKDYKEVLLKEYDTFNSYVKATKNILAPEDTLTTKFEKFIDELVRVKAALYKLNASDNEVEPLIYVFFDDVDLSNHRCVEILNVILRYLSKANIVTFVTGDYKIFSEMTTINLLDKDKLLKGDLVFKNFYELGVNEELTDDIYSALDMRKRLTKDILKKIMPPSLRYYMVQFDNEKKASFKYSVDGNNDYKELKELIFEKVIKPGLNISSDDIKDSIMYYKDIFIDTYFEIFDNTPRGLMNIYYFLYNIDEESLINDRMEFLRTLKSFVNVIVESSNTLIEYKDDIDTIFKIDGTQKDNVNYNYFDSELVGVVKEDYKILLLILFISQIGSINIQGYDEEATIEILNKNSGGVYRDLPFALYPKGMNIQFYMILNTLIRKMPRITGDNYNSEIKAIEFYLESLDKILTDEDYYREFYNISKSDSEWVKNIISAINLASENISGIFNYSIRMLEEKYRFLFTDNKIKSKFYEKQEKLRKKFSDFDYEMLKNYYFDILNNETKVSDINNNLIYDYLTQSSQLSDKLSDISGDLSIYNNIYKDSNVQRYRLNRENAHSINSILKESNIPMNSNIYKVINKIIENRYASIDDYNILTSYIEEREDKNQISGPMRRRLEYVDSIITELDWCEIGTNDFKDNDDKDIANIVDNLLAYIILKIVYDQNESIDISRKAINKFKEIFEGFLDDLNASRAFKMLIKEAMN